jgi:zeta-carotene isomerase
MQVWIAPGTGLANSFLEQLERLSQDSTAVMMAIFAVFALVHSGLAYLRPYGQLSLQPIR